MPKRNPLVFVFVGIAVLLGGLLVLASTRRATTDTPAAVGTATTTAAAAKTTTTKATSIATTATNVTAPPGMGSVRVSALPAEARTTLALIAAGGPYPYAQDGAVFQNREGVLPKKASTYYHEYTVETPGSSDRGARRIVVGRDGERYYTDDHYSTFRLVVT